MVDNGSRLFLKWRSEFSWLRRGRHGLKCKFCVSWLCDKPQKQSLVAHASGIYHQKLAAENDGKADARPAPDVQDFRACLVRRRKHESYRKSDDLGRSKEAKMTWCLAEAALDQERRQLKNAKSICISQDAQGQLLSARYNAALLSCWIPFRIILGFHYFNICVSCIDDSSTQARATEAALSSVQACCTLCRISELEALTCGRRQSGPAIGSSQSAAGHQSAGEVPRLAFCGSRRSVFGRR